MKEGAQVTGRHCQMTRISPGVSSRSRDYNSAFSRLPAEVSQGLQAIIRDRPPAVALCCKPNPEGAIASKFI
jgi:hypothetical protein